jgi:hypothetical protein
MRKPIYKFSTAILVVGLALALAGCCESPGMFGKIGNSMNTIQTAAQPLYQEAVSGSPEAQLGIAAANLAPVVADALQKQWCPDPAAAAKLAELAKALDGQTESLKSKGLIK